MGLSHNMFYDKTFTHVHSHFFFAGGIPLIAISTDMSDTVPDEKVAITYVQHHLFDAQIVLAQLGVTIYYNITTVLPK